MKSWIFSDRREFANAERGWLDNAEGKIIYAEDGKFAWDLQSYGDLNRDAPDTVNPSLWRNTQLNAKAGLGADKLRTEQFTLTRAFR